MVNTLRGIEALSDMSDEWIRRSIFSTQMMIGRQSESLENWYRRDPQKLLRLAVVLTDIVDLCVHTRNRRAS